MAAQPWRRPPTRRQVNRTRKRRAGRGRNPPPRTTMEKPSTTSRPRAMPRRRPQRNRSLRLRGRPRRDPPWSSRRPNRPTASLSPRLQAPALPAIPDGDETPATAPPAKAANGKRLHRRRPSRKRTAPPPKPQPTEVGRYTSEGQLLATLDRDDNLWYSKQPQEVLTAGERLVVLPPYRPQLALPSAVQLTFAGEGAADGRAG